MKRISSILLAILMLLPVIFTSCANKSSNLSTPSFAPLVFDSFEEFEQAVRNAKDGKEIEGYSDDMYNLAGLDFYYKPKYFLEDVELIFISVKNRYVCLFYEINELISKDNPRPYSREEEAERIKRTIKLEWVRNVNGQGLLEGSAEQLGYKEFQNGIYYNDIPSPLDIETIIATAYHFVVDDYYFDLDLPLGLEAEIEDGLTLAEMIKTVEKVYI